MKKQPFWKNNQLKLLKATYLKKKHLSQQTSKHQQTTRFTMAAVAAPNPPRE